MKKTITKVADKLEDFYERNRKWFYYAAGGATVLTMYVLLDKSTSKSDRDAWEHKNQYVKDTYGENLMVVKDINGVDFLMNDVTIPEKSEE